MDGELARALEMTQTPSNATITTTTNHANLKVIIESKVEDTTKAGRKTSGETQEDYDNGGSDEEGENNLNLNGSNC